MNENGFDDFKKRFLSRKPLSERMEKETKDLHRSGWYPVGFESLEPAPIEPESKKTKGSYTLYERKKLIQAAAELIEQKDNCAVMDLIEKVGISLSTYYRQLDYFKLNIKMIRDEAKEILKEK